MMMRVVFMIITALVAVPSATCAQDADMRSLSGDQIRELLVDSTVSGAHTRSGANFSEYYSPSGQILGESGAGPVADGCWAIRGPEMCYSYGAGAERRTACWLVTSNGRDVIFTTRDDRVDWIGVVEKGNPRGHSAPRPWTCGGTPARFDVAPGRLDIFSPRKAVE